MDKKILAEVIIDIVDKYRRYDSNQLIQHLLVQFEKSIAIRTSIDLLKRQIERNNKEDK
jgi:hypothetical protein